METILVRIPLLPVSERDLKYKDPIDAVLRRAKAGSHQISYKGHNSWVIEFSTPNSTRAFGMIKRKLAKIGAPNGTAIIHKNTTHRMSNESSS